MPLIPDTKDIVINSSPESIELPITLEQISSDLSGFGIDHKEKYLISGIHTLTGAVSIIPDSGATKYMEFNFEFRASLNTDTATGKTFSIFGFSFTNQQANTNANIQCLYNGTVWIVRYVPSFVDGDIIETRHLQNESVTNDKIAAGAIDSRTLQDSSVSEASLQSNILHPRVFKEQSIPNTAIQDKSIGRQKIGDHQITNDILGLMPPGSIKAGDATWLPVDVQMNDPGEGSIPIAQGYGKRVEPKLIGGHGRLDKNGIFSLIPGAVSNPYLGQYAVSPDKADDTMVSDTIQRDIDFAVAGQYKIKMGFKGVIWAITIYVDSTITGSNGVIEIRNDDDLVITTFTVNTGNTIGASYNNAVGVNNEFDKLDSIKAVVSGASGGKVHIDFLVVKRP